MLPGSKQVSGDLDWLRQQGLDVEIARHAAAGKRVLGFCGGLQMLGRLLSDPQGIDGPARQPGLGLLPLHTRYAAPKRVLPVRAGFGALAAPWQALSGIEAPTYEIRTGITEALPDAGARVALHDEQGAAIGWQQGPTLGVYAHGLFESSTVMRALFGTEVTTLDAAFDGLAELIDWHFEPGALDGLMRG